MDGTEPVFTESAVLRRELADLIETLDDAQWRTPSLCAGWTVRDVVGHLVAPVALPSRRLLTATLRAALRPHVANTLLAREVGAWPTAALAAALREHAADAFAPPVVGPFGPLTDLIVHGADIRTPLKLPFDPSTRAVGFALDFLCVRGAPGFVPRGRLSGLRVHAEDGDWAHGEGAEIAGRGVDLVVAVCGRPEALPALAGPGVDVLRGRLRAPMPLG